VGSFELTSLGALGLMSPEQSSLMAPCTTFSNWRSLDFVPGRRPLVQYYPTGGPLNVPGRRPLVQYYPMGGPLNLCRVGGTILYNWGSHEFVPGRRPLVQYYPMWGPLNLCLVGGPLCCDRRCPLTLIPAHDIIF
jgi:hypothetical protein